MLNPIEAIVQFNQDAGLLENGMDSFIETAYTFEESLEGFEVAMNGAHEDGTPVAPGDKEWISPRQWSLSLMNQIHQAFEQRGLPMMEEVDELDKAIDLIVFSIGKMAKMGLSPTQIEEAIMVVAEVNKDKIGLPKDKHGKQLKPSGWTGPEKELQLILNERTTI